MAEPTERTGLKSDSVELAIVDPKAPPDKEPVRARRAAFDRERVADILEAGNEKARVVARATLREVRRAMKLTY